MMEWFIGTEREADETGGARVMPRSGRSTRGIRETTAAMLGLASLLGVVTTALGIAYSIASAGSAGHQSSTSGQIIGGILIAFGSAVVGAVVSQFVTRQTGQDVLEDVRAVIAESLKNSFTSSDESLEPLRRDWYHYHLTGIGGKFVWRHDLYRFQRSASVGCLVATISVRDETSRLQHQYRLEGGVRGTRFIIMQTRINGTELPVIQVFPNMAESFRSIHCGIIMLQSWDGQNLISKTILSSTPLVAGAKEGDIDQAHSSTLERIWQDGFKRSHEVFPDATM